MQLQKTPFLNAVVEPEHGLPMLSTIIDICCHSFQKVDSQLAMLTLTTPQVSGIKLSRECLLMGPAQYN